jgi:hypothetical protein
MRSIPFRSYLTYIAIHQEDMEPAALKTTRCCLMRGHKTGTATRYCSTYPCITDYTIWTMAMTMIRSKADHSGSSRFLAFLLLRCAARLLHFFSRSSSVLALFCPMNLYSLHPNSMAPSSPKRRIRCTYTFRPLPLTPGESRMPYKSSSMSRSRASFCKSVRPRGDLSCTRAWKSAAA